MESRDSKKRATSSGSASEEPACLRGDHVKESRTAKDYFKYYGKIANQQNMLQDTIRTVFYK